MATDYDKTQELRGLKTYGLAEVSKLVGMTQRTLQIYAKEGRLKAVKIGNKWRVTESALRDFLKIDAEAAQTGD